MSGERILIIDDSREMVNHLSTQLLPAFGYKTSHAVDGQRGLELIRQEMPELILLDLNLPQMTGLDVLQSMAAERIDIPVILMTGFGSEKSAIEAFRLGIKDYLVKPFTSEEVIATIDRALMEARTRHDSARLVSKLRNVETELRRQVEDLNRAFEISRELLTLSERDQVLERALGLLEELSGAERSLIWLGDAGGQTLAAYQLDGAGLRKPGLDVSESLWPVWQVFRSGEAFRSALFVGDGMELLPGYFARAVLLVALASGERKVGVLGVSNHAAPIAFGDREQRLLEQLAGVVATVLDRVPPEQPAGAGDLGALNATIAVNVAHDLRGPLHSIAGFANAILLAGSLNEQQMQYAKFIVESAQRLSRLVDSLLDPVRLEAGLIEPAEPCDIRSIVRDVVQDMEGLALSRRITLRLSSPTELPAVWGHPERLAQAVRNLVDNALKFSPPGEAVTIELQLQEEQVCVIVADEGPGIAPADLPHIFEQFYRAPAMSDSNGSGVGLALVKAIAEAYGGSISATSEPGKGSSFALKLVTVATE